ncbi:hypothetical protein [Sphingomonas colocasiae]|uniref:Lipoprotein n=1 Tax=Sphingomonas colocasiae TaxID=1848973 RepID=A0ABS7PVZ6_9SPHN|nr:hypothetical protein [Sphingomonas colocasiae]MBY8825532.1 hypothetical protein [Sphingomonas colocasiae]
MNELLSRGMMARTATLACAAATLMLSGCGQERSATGEPGASATAAASEVSGGSHFPAVPSAFEREMSGALKDDQGLLPIEILAERGVSDRIEAAARAEPDKVFDVYKQLKTDSLCDRPSQSLGEAIDLEGGGRMPVSRDPDRVCDFLLSEAAKAGHPDANFERGVQDIVASETLYRKNTRYFDPEIEVLLQRAKKHFTIAQQSTTPGIPDAARQALSAFEAQQYSRGYGGADADRMRAMFLGFMAVAYISESAKFAAAADKHCRALQAGAMAALKPAPNC